ncbi:MAG: DNA-binding protein WhiA [Clostridia bacterium]|nr:DNA-binding protein WhiA [Clostridia bacterium]
MSFSTDVKKELCSIRTEQAATRAECHGMLVLCRSFSFDKILFQSGVKEVAEHFCSLLRLSFDVIALVKQGGSKKPVYSVEIASLADRQRILNMLAYENTNPLIINFDKIRASGHIKEFIKGAFLSAGMVSNPEKEYRAEFSFKSNEVAADFIGILDSKGFDFTMTYRAGKFLVYTKNSTTIEELLTYLGAGNETLNLIGVKVYKSIRNKSNRQNNFETSNIVKTANAAFKQTEAIKKLEQAGKLATLPEELLEAAKLRLNNPDMSLTNLCKLSKVSLTRSGLNHRLQKLLEMAEEL